MDKKSFKIILVFLLLVFSSTFATAAVWTGKPARYVRQGASGNGTSWSDAYGTLPATLTRGYVYYIADGTYGSYNCNDANSGSTYIYIVKATQSDHGTDTGWSTSYGDGQAVFNGTLDFDTSYWHWSGQTGGGPGQWETGFGFRWHQGSSGGKTVRIQQSPYPSYITVEHCELEGPGEGSGGTSDTIYNVGSSHVTFSYCWIHETNRTNILVNGSTYFTLEYSLISEKYGSDGTHGEHLSANINGNAYHTYRFNVWRNSGGSNTGVIVIKDSVQNHFDIYGNLFYTTNYCRYWVSNGIITDSTGDSTTYARVYNNTFMPHARADCSSDGITISWDVSTGNEFRNNIVFNNGALETVSRSNNLYDTSSLASGETGGQYWSSGENGLFINPSGRDYRLRTATNAGTTYGSPFNVDAYGVIRGGDGNWDRGAYEYDDGGTPSDLFPSISIASPTSGDSYQSEIQTLNISGTASDDNALPSNSVTWTCPECDVTSGIASGTTAWSISNLGLATGQNNFTVTVTDSAAQQTVDTLTIFYPAGDTDPPVATLVTPLSGDIACPPDGNLDFIITTNEYAECRLDNSMAVFDDMLLPMIPDGNGTYHTVTVPGVPCDTFAEGYYRCRDVVGNTTSATYFSFTTLPSGVNSLPEVVSTAINLDGDEVTISFTEEVDTTNLINGSFNVDCVNAGTDILLTNVSGTYDSRTFLIDRVIYAGDNCNLDYTGGANEVEDLEGADLQTFTNKSVINGSTATQSGDPGGILHAPGGLNFVHQSGGVSIVFVE